MIGRVARWFDDRLRTSDFAHRALNKVFPDDWSFMLGEIALYSFVLLVLTGTFLTFFFVPSAREIVYQGTYEPLRGVPMSEAYASVLELSFGVRAGLVMRQTHHWAALVFIGAIVVHLARVFFTGAFRRPREINWMIGLTLLLLALFNGFSGYSLPDDLLSGTGLRIAYSIALSVPLLGTWIAFLIFGGEFPADAAIPRLFVGHIFIVPLLLFALISIHLALIWHQKHTQHAGPGRTETNVVGPTLWPTYAAKSVGLFFGIAAVLGAMGGLIQINPVWLYGPFDPAAVTSPAQPDWYLGWLEGALRIFPPWELRVAGHTIPNQFFPGVLLPGITFLVLYLWPFLEARVSGDRAAHHLLDRPRDHPARTAIGAAGLAFYGLLFLAASNDVLATLFVVPVGTVTLAFQILVLLLPPAVGLVTLRLMRSLRDSGAPDLLQLPLREAIAADRRASRTASGER